MTTTLTTKLEIKSWDEDAIRETDDGRKTTRATVELGGAPSDGADSIESGNYDSLMTYRADGTSAYVVVAELSATLAGRSGSFVLQGSGGFDGTTASWSADIVATDSGLDGLTGSARSESTHDDYPNMPITLSYDIG